MSKPLLSIGMIVKNEERSLEKCLKALQPIRDAIPCELIIADTGSTDRTVEIAKKYADEVFYFEWIKDFAAARNAVIDHAHADWFMAVDADEYFNSSTKELVNFVKSSEYETATVATFVQRNYRNPDMKGEYADFNAVRLGHISLGLRFKGSIHEAFDTKGYNGKAIVLFNTIFDHDGYTSVTPTAKKDKEKRNLDLLEKELKNDPKSYRRILQCLESSTTFDDKRRYFVNYAVSVLKEKDFKEVENSLFFLPMLFRQIVLYGVHDDDPNTKEYIEWAYKYCPKEPHTLIDITFSEAEYSFKQKDYQNAIKAAKKYLKNVTDYKKNAEVSLTSLTSPLDKAHELHQERAQFIIASSLLKLEKESEAINILKQPFKYLLDKKLFHITIPTLTELYDNPVSQNLIKTHLNPLLEDYKNFNLDDPELFQKIIRIIQVAFNFNEENQNKYQTFKEVDGAIGLSAKIIDATTKEDVEKYLNNVEDFEFFMPSALKKVISYKIPLPEKFYKINHLKMEFILSNLAPFIEDVSQQLTEYYFNLDNITLYHELSFAFNFISQILLNNDTNLSSQVKLSLVNSFAQIAEPFLTMTYSEQLLDDEESVNCLPVSTAFAWYFLNAEKIKKDNPLKYVKTLRVIIKKIPESKNTIKLILDTFAEAEEKRTKDAMKQNPELMAMAEQLKTLLKTLPENSPQLDAIKQSPTYKQVAHLIEE